jgi:hypothetical protein
MAHALIVAIQSAIATANPASRRANRGFEFCAMVPRLQHNEKVMTAYDALRWIRGNGGAGGWNAETMQKRARGQRRPACAWYRMGDVARDRATHV